MLTYNKIKIGIIDYKLNNLFSIYNGIKKIGYNTSIIEVNIDNYKKYDIVILPGVGSYDSAMRYIKYYNINQKLYEFLSKKNKLLFGICLGMQLLFEKSFEFKNTKGLCLIEGSVKKLIEDKWNPVPHIGWNNVMNVKKNIFELKKSKNFYFVHSFYCDPKNKKNVITETKYGRNKFCSVVQTKNILATQFHPEKSGLTGIDLLKKLKK